MTGAEYIAMYLSTHGTTDAFGVPGGVVLDLIYAFDRQEGIVPHLTYHEQSAGFAACGYAQASGRLGVAYATRGPGFTNLLTAVADAFFDSVPVLFLTAHSADCPPDGMRVMSDQEIDTCGMVQKITKYSARIDELEHLPNYLHAACSMALDGRKGAVFLDVSTRVLREEIHVSPTSRIMRSNARLDEMTALADEFAGEIRGAKRPVLLIGDGVNQAGACQDLHLFLAQSGLPCISSRFSHDVACPCENYFGYVGSHGIRAANFILSKADVVISLGNRLNVPTKSFSFSKVLSKAKFLRYEIDESEFCRGLPNSLCRKCDIASLLNCLSRTGREFGCHADWVRICGYIYRRLENEDMNDAVERIVKMMETIPSDAIVISDVGNHEFFVSRAAVRCKLPNRVLYSKSFGTMGSALGRSIGAYYATRRPVVCFVGDQGLQFNVQELQYVSMHRLPLTIVLLNNGVSGMIRDKERSGRYEKFLHVSASTGFATPNIPKLVESYGIGYIKMADDSKEGISFGLSYPPRPLLVDCKIKEDVSLTPNLPFNCLCQDLRPSLPEDLYQSLDNL